MTFVSDNVVSHPLFPPSQPAVYPTSDGIYQQAFTLEDKADKSLRTSADRMSPRGPHSVLSSYTLFYFRWSCDSMHSTLTWPDSSVSRSIVFCLFTISLLF